jgi:F-type H+-transporting ATPase subunit gamma
LANARVIVKRRKSVRNIRKITRTMQLIATARFQAAYNRAMATKPYTERLAELAAALSDTMQGEVSHPLMQANPDAKRVALVVITTKRGLCGGYNTNVLRHALAHLREAEGRGVETDGYMVGKKGINYFRFLRREMRERITDISDAPRFNQVEPIANGLMDRFTRGELGAVHVAYMRFLSTARQAAEVVQLLPLSSETTANGGGSARRRAVQYEFSPDPKELLAELLPATVRVQLFQCFTDATVSEQVGRMVAMKAATDAAGEMITALTRQYNRARQTQITMELLDIVGGANALA